VDVERWKCDLARRCDSNRPNSISTRSEVKTGQQLSGMVKYDSQLPVSSPTPVMDATHDVTQAFLGFSSSLVLPIPLRRTGNGSKSTKASGAHSRGNLSMVSKTDAQLLKVIVAEP